MLKQNCDVIQLNYKLKNKQFKIKTALISTFPKNQERHIE